MPYERPCVAVIRGRLDERPRTILAVVGPRQVGKTTAVRQAIADRPSVYEATDRPSTSIDPNVHSEQQLRPGTPVTTEWLVTQWKRARNLARVLAPGPGLVLVIDEIQKVPSWSDAVKGLWDEDRATGLNMHVVLLGSSPWLMQKGLTESLAGRFELLRLAHWTYPEMQAAFDLSLDEFLYFGGYPGPAPYIRDERRWRDYIRSSMIHPNIERDILEMTRVDKPAVLKQLFELGCLYSGQIVAFNKLLGRLQDVGNTTTLTHYLELLSRAGLLTGLPKYSGKAHLRRASVPKLNVLNTALISAISRYDFDSARSDRTYWGRVVESAAGAHLFNSASTDVEVFYWRESPDEVDFVLSSGARLLAIEVKSGPVFESPRGLEVFTGRFRHASRLIVGSGGVSLTEFLSEPADHWIGFS